MVDFVTLSSLSEFEGNPILEQHRLRYKSVILRQNWQVPHYQKLEYDEYDNPVAKYLIYRGKNGEALACSRFCPTNHPYMLEEKFGEYISKIPMPKSKHIWEGSRLCIDHTLPAKERKLISNRLIVGYLEMALLFNVEAIVGLMYPACWQSVFIKAGWDIEFIGDVLRLDDGHKAQAAWLPVNKQVLDKVRVTTGIRSSLLKFGDYDALQVA